MPPEVAKFLLDVRQACAHLQSFVQGKTFDDYTEDVLLRSAVERQLTIIGEALTQASKVMPTLAGSISNLRQILAFRNILVHGYAVVDHAVVWGVLQKDLSLLKDEADRLLAQP